MAIFSKKLFVGFVFSGFVLIGLSMWLVSMPRATVSLTPPPTSRSYFEPLIPWQLPQGETVYVSLADTADERTLGLSHTTTLPSDVVKLFIFETDSAWSFWMKDMYYPIDMVWLDATGTVVHVAENVKPETYPESFRPAISARYVIETNAGQASRLGFLLGETLPIRDLIK
jgi:uncharacterized membrane protein (UPF0127 family)